mmetsp:Transcript_32742/g.72331  ORF Transcript_32742/g.72331 Transcript_32742/m.72331 type:complete len:258 (+) Transcript_32742:140-913(+)|eukprot:CAMPEP_0202901510 /NCGR_PEP_ID=MMETSP1392-20130828/14291_1 /ASSEMBLY_ACC=CAM_ASM_000868 /TAXON_ID=225041 /ORGANISM="Chlamydomonas chlamydogama, Strain SAG 11-48b" /LENGTH=257 /DNA_ID=CAMNT_0049588077 /DNA_START=96 /DNA_END=869 /DNA_ORIENTATION=+
MQALSWACASVSALWQGSRHVKPTQDAEGEQLDILDFLLILGNNKGSHPNYDANLALPAGLLASCAKQHEPQSAQEAGSICQKRKQGIIMPMVGEGCHENPSSTTRTVTCLTRHEETCALRTAHKVTHKVTTHQVQDRSTASRSSVVSCSEASASSLLSHALEDFESTSCEDSEPHLRSKLQHFSDSASSILTEEAPSQPRLAPGNHLVGKSKHEGDADARGSGVTAAGPEAHAPSQRMSSMSGSCSISHYRYLLLC